MKRFASIIVIFSALTGCAALEPKVNEVSLQSYEQGCTLRGMQRGTPPKDAQAVCRCHVEKAISLTSPQAFLEQIELVGRADEAERDTDTFREAVQLMKSTFNECRQTLGVD